MGSYTLNRVSLLRVADFQNRTEHPEIIDSSNTEMNAYIIFYYGLSNALEKIRVEMTICWLFSPM